MYEERIILLLTRKVAGEITANELMELDELLRKNPDALYYEEFLNQLWLQANLPVPNQDLINEQYERHLLKYGDELNFQPDDDPEPATEIVPRRRILKYMVPLLVLLVVAGILIQRSLDTKPAASYTTIITGKGMRKKLELPDGTKIWLNSESSLSYEYDMLKKATRSVKLSGEAFFDVAHDKQHPFIVHAEKMTIKVLGTAFNVEAYPNEGKSTATLIRGSIELSVNNIAHSNIKLKPSQKFDLIDHNVVTDKSSAAIQRQEIILKLDNVVPYKVGGTEYIAETSWKENRLIIRNETFEELIPKLDRWFSVHINITNKKAENYRFTGVFTDENIDDALKAMQTIKPFNYRKDNNDVNIY